MKKKILKILLVIMAITVLTINNFLILGVNITEAVYEELENQTTALNSSIDYNAYFKVGDGEVHSMTASINQGANLYININVKDSGVALDNGKIKFENANFKLGEVKNDFVKKVDYEAKEIELNQIVYGNNIVIELPITFEKNESMDVGYFDAQNVITLSGTYKKNTSEKQVSGNIKTELMWSEEADTSISQNIEKYMSLGESGVLLQNKITVSVVNNVLPKQNEKVTINVPQIKNNKPEQAIIIKNGIKLTSGINYNNETGILTIETSNNVNQENKVVWGNGIDEYKIIYTYNKDVGEESQSIILDTTVDSKLYTKENAISKKDTQNVNISKMGSIASIEQNMTKEQYKGYMYANVDNETEYNETSIIEISNASSLNKVELTSEGDYYLDENGVEYDTQNATYFKQTLINKEEMLRILGQEGTVTIYKNENELVSILNKDTQTDDSGNMVVAYEGNNTNNIKIVTSKPYEEGKLKVNNTKAIRGKTGYTKKQLKIVTALESKVQVTGNDVSTSKTVMLLKDTITDAGITLNTNNLSTLQENKNVQISVDLKTDTNKYDLYKNPTIKLKLPSDVEKFELNGEIQKLYGDEFAIESANYNANDKIVYISFKGEQTEFGNSINQGMHIVIDANITLNKLAASKQDAITMTYTNENGQEGSYEKSVGVNIVSKEGILTYTNISGYNESNDVVEALGQDIANGKLDVENIARTATANMSIVNNYGTEINDIVIIGRIPEQDERQVNDTKLSSTFATYLSEGITTNNVETKIYYSEDINANEDSQTWNEAVESFEKVRAYKIVLNNNINASGMFNFGYKFNIPENIEVNQSTYINYEVAYTYAGQRVMTNSSVTLSTDVTNSPSNDIMLLSTSVAATQNTAGQTVEIAEGVSAEITAFSGESYLEENASLNGGQNVKYVVKINNNSGKDINNLQLTAEHTNVTFYGTEVVQMQDIGAELIDTNWYKLKTNEKNKQFSLDKLENGKSKEFMYEFQVNNANEQNSQVQGKLKFDTEEFNKEVELNSINITKGEIALSLLKNNYIEYPYRVQYPESIVLTAKNISTDTIKNKKISIPLNNQIDISNVYINEETGAQYKIENDVLEIDLEKLEINQSIDFYVNFVIKEFEGGHLDLTLEASTDLNNVKYYSNQFIQGLDFEKSKLEIEQTVDKKNNTTLNKGEEFNVTLKIKNDADFTDAVEIYSDVPEILTLTKISKGGIEQEKEEELDVNSKIKPSETIVYIFTFKVNDDLYLFDDVTINFSINAISYFGKTDEIYYKLNTSDSINTDGDNTSEDNKDDNNQNDNEGKNDELNLSISGCAWLDVNKNGYKDEDDEKIVGTKVYLINSGTGEVVKDSYTDQEGKYNFERLNEGDYLIAFEFDDNKYRITNYKKNTVDESKNSDVISKQVNINGNQKVVAITDNIQIKDENIKNIDAGFIQNEKFDLKLDKYITKVTIQNDAGTTVQQYNNEQLAKVEIRSKNLANTLVLIEYTINVTNEGELPGYIGEILDYMPNDLKFSSEINKDWYVSTDGNLHNITLANEKLEAGQTKTLKLILTKTMTNSNTGLVINSAEIGKANNELNISDIDSMPANKVDGEDDMSKAEIIISVSTGREIIFTILIILSFTVIAGIVIVIIKRKEGKNGE